MSFNWNRAFEGAAEAVANISLMEIKNQSEMQREARLEKMRSDAWREQFATTTAQRTVEREEDRDHEIKTYTARREAELAEEESRYQRRRERELAEQERRDEKDLDSVTGTVDENGNVLTKREVRERKEAGLPVYTPSQSPSAIERGDEDAQQRQLRSDYLTRLDDLRETQRKDAFYDTTYDQEKQRLDREYREMGLKNVGKIVRPPASDVNVAAAMLAQKDANPVVFKQKDREFYAEYGMTIEEAVQQWGAKEAPGDPMTPSVGGVMRPNPTDPRRAGGGGGLIFEQMR